VHDALLRARREQLAATVKQGQSNELHRMFIQIGGRGLQHLPNPNYAASSCRAPAKHDVAKAQALVLSLV